MKTKRFILVLLLVFSSAMLVYAQLFSRDFGQEFRSTPTGQAFLQAFGALKANYLNDVDDEMIIQGAIEGMLEALEDPYTSYALPKEAARENQDRTGSFEGIGAVLSARNRAEDKIVEIINVYKGGPASQAGLQRGDIFAEVDGVNVEDFTVSEVVDVVRGPKGTTVVLGMRRPGVNDIVYFSIIRDKIDIVSVESTVLDHNVGYIKLHTFANQRVHEQLVEQLDELRAQGIGSLILDLRDNGGGLLTQGILVADEFLSAGDIVFQRQRGVTQRIASADAHFFDLPMVVLMNKNSASASEIVAGALQDNDRALVIGEESFGKGVGQSVVSLPDGGQLVYLSFEWLTPSRRSINNQGIIPDVLAEDDRFSNVIALEGTGAEAGQVIEFVVGGEVVGSVEANEDGEFKFIQFSERPPMSSVQGEALVDIASDNALRIAYDTLLEEVLNQRVSN